MDGVLSAAPPNQRLHRAMFVASIALYVLSFAAFAAGVAAQFFRHPVEASPASRFFGEGMSAPFVSLSLSVKLTAAFLVLGGICRLVSDLTDVDASMQGTLLRLGAAYGLAALIVFAFGQSCGC